MAQKIHPNIFRLGKTKEWNSKYYEKKSADQPYYIFKNIEIQNFIKKFFKTNNMLISNCKINYSNKTLYIFVVYYLTLKSNFLITKNLIKKSSKKHNKIAKRIKFFHYKKKQYYNNYYDISKKKTQIHLKNFKTISFTEKFFKSLHYFINKKEIKTVLVLKQLNKNIKLKFTKKKLGSVQERLSELRRYEKNLFFNESLNIFFTFIENNESAELIANFIANQLKQLKKNHNFFLRFIKTTLTLFNNKALNSKIRGIKIKIKGKFNKTSRAKHKIITIGNLPILTMTSNIDYSKKTSYSPNGTFGVKVWTYKNL